MSLDLADRQVIKDSLAEAAKIIAKGLVEAAQIRSDATDRLAKATQNNADAINGLKYVIQGKTFH